LSNEEKTNDYENFEKGMIYMKILKKGGKKSPWIYIEDKVYFIAFIIIIIVVK
jgi:hypothetical protein